MPKLPTFQAEGSVSQLAGTTSNVQVPLTQTLGTALKPVTDFVVKQKIKETDFQNKTEALKLENEFVTEMAKVYDEANILDNKDLAQSIVKEKSNALISKLADQATNTNVKTLFTNNALSEVQKGIFRTNTAVSKNILTSLTNKVQDKEGRLLANAFLAEGDFDYAVLATDLEKLYADNFKGLISNAKYNEIVNSIPSTIELFEARKGITDNPKETLINLKDSEKFKAIPLDERFKLIDDAKRTLRQPVIDDFNNFIAAANRGKKIEFDIGFAKEVLDIDTYNAYATKYKIATETVADAAVLNSIPLKDLTTTLDSMIKGKYDKYGEVDAQAFENNLKKITSNRLEEMKNDPVKFLAGTNDTISEMIEDIRLSDGEIKTQKQLELTNLLYETQKKMGSPDYEIKVVSKNEAISFVETYMKADEGERIALLEDAENRFGDFFSKAMNEYSAQGLPITAEFSSFFGNPNLTKKFLSFDSEDERKKLDKVLINNDTSITKVREAIFDNLAEFRKAVVFGNRFDTSAAADKLDRMEVVLSYYAASEIFVTGDVNKAIKNASSLIKDNFDIQETFFVPRIYNGETLNQGQIDFVIDKSKKVLNYLDEWGMQSFGSTKLDDQKVLDQEMKEQIKENGRWVNNTDGTGIIFGIIMGDGSFAPLINKDNETLEIMFDDDSLLVPNTDIIFNQITKRKKKRGQ
tara:strand:- start:2113 stop:4194 length:2082 start_codon:yes stop_codon:yes gene_type:complete